jgi:hypothetical protein
MGRRGGTWTAGTLHAQRIVQVIRFLEVLVKIASKRIALAAGLLLVATFVIGAPKADSAPITTLYNTGAGTTAGNIDPNYQIVFSPGAGSTDAHNAGYTTATVAAYEMQNVWPLAGVPNGGPWVANNGVSQWITPNVGGTGASSNAGFYVYRTTFDLTGFNPTTARISGSWSSDNDGFGVYLNGIGMPDFTTAVAPGLTQPFSSMIPFDAITTGFVGGTNTLYFAVYNTPQGGGNPSGLRVEMTGTANAARVPEPGTMMLLGSGLVGLAAFGRKKARR